MVLSRGNWLGKGGSTERKGYFSKGVTSFLSLLSFFYIIPYLRIYALIPAHKSFTE